MLQQKLDRFSTFTGNLVAPLTLVMMILSVIVVISRYFFDIGATPVQELVVYLHGCIFMLGTAYTLKEQAHVRVDVVYQRFSRKTRAAIDLLGTLLFLFPVSGFVFWTSLDYVSLSWAMREGSPEPGGLPGLYLLKSLVPAMAVLLALQGLAEALRAISVIADRNG